MRIVTALACGSSSTACLVSDPPDYDAPSPSILLLAQTAIPATTQVFDVNQDVPTTFQVEVRSEDAGEDLLAQLFLDYPSLSLAFNSAVPFPPSTLDRSRNIGLPLVISSILGDVFLGCHTVTMVLTHGHSGALNNNEDFAQLTWWINVHPKNGTETQPATLEGCPKLSARQTQEAAP